jgi:tetratricopeptide (TPR) repeat protein
MARTRQEILIKLDLPKEKKTAGQKAVDAFVCADLAYREHWRAGSVGDRSIAAGLLKQVFAEEVPLGQAFALRGLMHLEQGKAVLALADADKAFAVGAGDVRAHLVRGRARLQRGNLAAALGDLEQARQLSGSKDAVVLHWLATAQFQAGQRNKALLTQRQAIELRPRDEEMQAQLREFELELTRIAD